MSQVVYNRWRHRCSNAAGLHHGASAAACPSVTREIQMAKSRKGPVGRRGFLKGAAVGAAALVPETHAAPAHSHQDHDHDHDHQAVPSDVALRVKALESLLVEK